MINLPSETKKWSQTNNSDLFGNVYTTKNINFDDEGYLKLSGSPRAIQNEGIDADIDNSSFIAFKEGDYYTQTWDDPFTFTDLSTTPTKDTGANAPGGGIGVGGVWFAGKFLVSTRTSVQFFTTGGTGWADTNVSLSNTSQAQHPIVAFVSKASWAVANVNTVLLHSTISATPTLTTTLTIPADFYITSMVYFNQNLYIGTRHTQGGKAVMYVWNGSGTAAQGAFEIDSFIIHDIATFQSSIILLSSSGALYRFTGAGFDPLGYLPIFFTPYTLADYQNINLYHNCLKTNDDVVYINFSYSTTTDVWLNQPAGIWCYDPNVGLYNKYCLGISNVVRSGDIATASVSVANDTITVPAAPITGTQCIYKSASSTVITGLKKRGLYYVIKVDATTIKLASTKANALAGTAIDLTGTGNASQSIVFFPETDYGQFISYRPMAILPMTQLGSNPEYAIDLIWSSELVNRSSPDLLGYLGTISEAVDSRGYFVSPKVFSLETTDHFNNFVVKYSTLTDNDKIIVKYRTTDDGLDRIISSDWDMTWTSSTTFTTTETGWANAFVGDEVEVLQGAGSGLLAHITEIALNAGTYTITLDETFDQYTANDIGIAVFRNWTKFLTLTSADTEGFVEKQLGVAGKFIQIKVELRGKGVKIEEIKIDNKYLLPSSK
jgi:hypothetical protein